MNGLNIVRWEKNFEWLSSKSG